MNAIYQSCEIIKEDDILKKIEICGRTCYQSGSKITETSSKDFVSKLLTLGHESVFEHIWLELILSSYDFGKLYRYHCEKVVKEGKESFIFFNPMRVSIIGNIRAIRDLTKRTGYNFKILYDLYPELFPDSRESKIFLDSKLITNPNITTVKFTTNRNVSHQLVRHEAEISQESQRYVVPSGKDKDSDKGMKFIIPVQFIQDGKVNKDLVGYNIWKHSCINSERDYMKLKDLRFPPQLCRNVLNSSIKTEIVMTCLNTQWEHIFRERLTNGADPQTRNLMQGFYNEFSNK
jgi:thymidylate synthase (FAD)